MKPMYEANTPEEALPAWVLVKRQTLSQLYLNDSLLANYRHRPNSRNLKRLVNGVLNLYGLVRPKLPKLKDCEELTKQLKGIEQFTAEIPDDPDPKQWIAWHFVTTDAVEAIGITRITKPTEREGSELVGDMYSS